MCSADGLPVERLKDGRFVNAFLGSAALGRLRSAPPVDAAVPARARRAR